MAVRWPSARTGSPRADEGGRLGPWTWWQQTSQGQGWQATSALAKASDTTKARARSADRGGMGGSSVGNCRCAPTGPLPAPGRPRPVDTRLVTS